MLSCHPKITFAVIMKILVTLAALFLLGGIFSRNSHVSNVCWLPMQAKQLKLVLELLFYTFFVRISEVQAVKIKDESGRMSTI